MPATPPWVAASDDGLAAIDIGNLAAPATLGSKKFKKDANSLILNGSEAVVAVGGIVLVSVNISNPAAMTLNSPEQATSFNIPMADRRAFLNSRINGRGAAVDSDRIFIDALRAWFAATGGNAPPASIPMRASSSASTAPRSARTAARSDRLASWGD